MYQEHVDALSIKDLRAALKSAGLQNGPITITTESVYRALLSKYLVAIDSETANTSQLNSSNSDIECIESASESDDEANNASELPVGQVPAVLPDKPKTKFTPIRWNHRLQRYESVYDETSNLLSTDRDDNHLKGARSWLIMAGAVLLLAFVIGILFLSSERDPYKGLEQAASQMTKPPEKVVEEQ